MLVDSGEEMINIEALYFSISKDLLRAVGLWPYQQTRLVQLQYTLLFGILLATIVFHFTTFMTAECTSDLIVKVLASAFIFINLVLKYNAFWMHSVSHKELLKPQIRKLLDQLQSTCGELKDRNEIAIIEKYGNISRRYTVFLTVIVVCSEFIFILVQIWVNILDNVQPGNASRPRILFFPIEYFVDQQRYFYLILLHINTALCIGCIMILATLSVLVSCQECICGMFAIASYRIEHAIRTDVLRNASLNGESLISEEIIRAVDIHCEAMKFSKFLMSKFELAFGFMIVAGVMALTLNLFRIFQVLSSGTNIEELLLPAGYTFMIAMYMFTANYIGQDLTDHNRRIFATVYNVQWYEAPLHVQKMIVFLLQKGVKDFTLTVGGLINGSMKCFATLTNTSISYFTVLYSMQK